MSFDTIDENRSFAAKYRFPFPLLSDPDRSIAMAYGAADRPDAKYPRRLTFVISSEGAVEQAIDTKDPGGQADAILKTL